MLDSLKKNIKELEHKNRLITNQLIDAIWVVDAETLTFDYITSSIETISGFPAESYIGQPVRDKLTELSFLDLNPMMRKSVLERERKRSATKTIEVELVHKTGDAYWAEIRAKLVNDKDGSLKIVGVTRNISKQKSAEIKQQELIEKLKVALEKKAHLMEEVETLRGLLPICSGCKRIRDKNGKWWPIDIYVKKHTKADLTHTICKDCSDVFYGES